VSSAQMLNQKVSQAIANKEIHNLYSAHHGWLQNWLGFKLGNSHDAADIAHDTFLKLLTGRRKLNELGNEPRGLLTHIARHLVIDHWRRQNVERAYIEVIAQLPEAETPSPEMRLLILEALQRIEAMLNNLPALTREMFLLAQLDGFIYAKIAEQKSISLTTVKRHMSKAFLACLQLN